MKQITDYITEKFHINSKTVANKNKEAKIMFDRNKVDIPKEDVDRIIDFANELPEIPLKIEYFQNSNTIRLGYSFNGEINRSDYDIGFEYIETNYTKGYKLEYFITKKQYYKYVPDGLKKWTLDECFEDINKEWDDFQNKIHN